MVPLCLCLDWYNNDFEIRLLWREIGLDNKTITCESRLEARLVIIGIVTSCLGTVRS